MTEREIGLDDVMPLIRERLGEGHEVTFSPRGASMLPLLFERRDTVTLSAPPQKLKKFDIILYQRKNGQYVLHRVVKVGETYTCVGDNQFVFETGISYDQVIAVCTSFMRNGKKVGVNSLFYRFYAIFWHYSRFPRRVILAIRRRILRLWNKK